MTDGTLLLPDGRVLAYVDWNPNGANAVLRMQGAIGSRYHCHPDVELGARLDCRVVTFDRPGFGGSTPNPGRSVASIAEDARLLLDHLEIEDVAVMGLSGGGPHALAVAAVLGSRVAHCALLCTAGTPPRSLATLAARNAEAHRAVAAGRDATIAYLSPMITALQNDPTVHVDWLPADTPAADRAALSEAATQDMIAKDIAEAVRQGPEGAADEFIALTTDWGFDLAKVSQHVCIWHGRQDRNVPVTDARDLGERLPSATFIEVEEAGHMIFATHERSALQGLVASTGAEAPQ